MFVAVTLLLPLLLLAAVEAGLRVWWKAGALPLFTPFEEAPDRLRVANRSLAHRYFPAEAFPPTPPLDPFAAEPPRGTLRIFVLGESTTAGFPYPRNVLFSRTVADILRDALPTRQVEVVNLGLAATNSFALVDIIDEVLAERPDAILVYAGHNEYYGALGVGSSIGSGLSPVMTRITLRLQRLRTVMLLRNALAAVRRPGAASKAGADAASFMEVVARDQEIPYGGESFDRGVRQFEDNLRLVLRRTRQSNVPTFVGSLASNERDQPPFAAAANALGDGAGPTYAQARAAFARGDSAAARAGFRRARDLDVVRFRAPSLFNDVIRRVAAEMDARYVPVAEAFASASPGGIPGADLFLEHVHPNARGYALLGAVYADAVLAAGIGGTTHVRPSALEDYERRRNLTWFDERIAHHTARTLTSRWPFVPAAQSQDYRGIYVPTGAADSLALLVSRGGIRWEVAKARLAEDFLRRGDVDAAVAEYRGLIRDRPWDAYPLRAASKALLARGRTADAEPYIDAAFQRDPRAEDALVLAALAAARKDFSAAAQVLERAHRASPRDPRVLYQLSLARGLSGDVEAAHVAARKAVLIDPGFPGLADWLALLERSRAPAVPPPPR